MSISLRVEREIFSTNSTIGKLYVDGQFHCYTLEPQSMNEDVKPRAIPTGSYALIDRWSTKHHRNVPGVLNVPGFEDIEVHWGNEPKDTEGCLLVGLSYNAERPDFIGDSKMAFGDLYETLRKNWDDGQKADITYVSGGSPTSEPSE